MLFFTVSYRADPARRGAVPASPSLGSGGLCSLHGTDNATETLLVACAGALLRVVATEYSRVCDGSVLHVCPRSKHATAGSAGEVFPQQIPQCLLTGPPVEATATLTGIFRLAYHWFELYVTLSLYSRACTISALCITNTTQLQSSTADKVLHAHMFSKGCINTPTHTLLLHVHESCDFPFLPVSLPIPTECLFCIQLILV